MATVQERTKTLQSLLRGELSAVETYQQALEKLADEPGADGVKRLEREHRGAVEYLQRLIRDRGEQPAMESGAWGAFARAVEGTSKLLGNTPALKALKEGEEHGIKEYVKALEDSSLDSDCESLIRNTLLPQQRGHIPVLDRLMSKR